MLNWSLVVSSTASVIATNGPPSASRAPFRTDAIPLSLITVLRSTSINGDDPATARPAMRISPIAGPLISTSPPSLRVAVALASWAPFARVNSPPLALITLSTMDASPPARLAVVVGPSTWTNAWAPA